MRLGSFCTIRRWRRAPQYLVAPIVAASPAVPVAVAAGLGDSLGLMAYLGLLVAVVGVVTTVSTSGDAPDTAPSPCRGAIRLRGKARQRFWRPYPCVVLALLATALFGFALVILDVASKRPAADLLGHGRPADRSVTAAHRATLGYKTTGACSGADRRLTDRGDRRQQSRGGHGYRVCILGRPPRRSQRAGVARAGAHRCFGAPAWWRAPDSAPRHRCVAHAVGSVGHVLYKRARPCDPL